MTNGEHMLMEALGVMCGDKPPTTEQMAQAKQYAREYHDRCKAHEVKMKDLKEIHFENLKAFESHANHP